MHKRKPRAATQRPANRHNPNALIQNWLRIAKLCGRAPAVVISSSAKGNMKSLPYAIATLLLIALDGKPQQYTISTFAGGAAPPAPIQALDAVFTYPAGIATDPTGNVYFSSTGDGGPAINAVIHAPSGIALDAAGNLYIPDAHARVRKVSPDGTITTIAGNGKRAYTGDGGPAAEASLVSPYAVALDTAGNLFVSDADAGAIRQLSPSVTTPPAN